MKLVWSPDIASKAYIDTVKSGGSSRESGVAEFVSAMAAGWNSKYIVETWSEGGVIATSIGLNVARNHTGGRHVCIVPDEVSQLAYIKAMSELELQSQLTTQVIVGEAEDIMEGLVGIDFMVVDCQRRDFSRFLSLAKLSSNGAVLICKNANLRSGSGFEWRSVVEDGGFHYLQRSVFLPVGKGLDMAHVASSGGDSSSGKGKNKWIKYIDKLSREEHLIQKKI